MAFISLDFGEIEGFGRWMRHWPAWVPPSMLAYMAHTELGISVRALARIVSCHPSTVSRQISRWEQLRDDPLIDEALVRCVGPARYVPSSLRMSEGNTSPMQATIHQTCEATLPDDKTFNTEARRILRRLGEPGAVLAISADMEKGVVVRDTASGTTARTAVVDRVMAQALALKDWIACAAEGRISRYRITAAGRSALNQLLAEAENRASGFAEAATHFEMDGAGPSASNRKRGIGGETPLMVLSRRREKDGALFLSPAQVAAGERLREDFELAQLGKPSELDWDAVILGAMPQLGPDAAPLSSQAALRRTVTALHELGAGLGDVALRCCCLLEGLESAERALGWSARSGKVVLRIALERLVRHYDGLGDDSKMIG